MNDKLTTVYTLYLQVCTLDGKVNFEGPGFSFKNDMFDKGWLMYGIWVVTHKTSRNYVMHVDV